MTPQTSRVSQDGGSRSRVSQVRVPQVGGSQGQRRTASVDLTAAPRAVLRESVRLLYRLVGQRRLGSARDNAWAAVCADRERAQERAETNQMLEDARSAR